LNFYSLLLPRLIRGHTPSFSQVSPA
jgi:hypothetical protein